MTRTFEWTLNSGKQGKLEVTYAEVMVRETFNADGDIVAAGHMPSDAGNSKMIAYIDGKKVGDCWNKNFWKLIDGSAAGTKKIWGLNIAFSAENAERYEKFIAELIADGTSDDVKAYRANKKSEAREEEIAYAKETIAAAEAQSDIPTAKEARARQIQYNDIHNEGGEGYVPRWVSKEEYENAKSILANQ